MLSIIPDVLAYISDQAGSIGTTPYFSSLVGVPLVPKLHLGTQLIAKLYFAGVGGDLRNSLYLNRISALCDLKTGN